MKYYKRFAALLLCLCLLLTGCEKLSVPTNANTAFRNFTLCLFQEEVASNTINLHYSLQEPEKYGIINTPVTLGSFDFDETLALASIENWDTALHKFSYRSLSEENRLTYDILSYYFDLSKKSISYYYYEEPLSPVTGIHAQLPVLLAEYQLLNKEDIDTYLVLLETLPDYFASIARFEKEKSARGLFMSDAVADEVIEQCNAFVSMGDDNYLLSTFEERLKTVPDLNSEECNKYVQKNTKIVYNSVLPAYKALISSLNALKSTKSNTQGLCYLPEGKAYYAHLATSETGSGRTIEELQVLIQKQITQDITDMQKILEKNPDILEQTSTTLQSPDSILKTLKQDISKSFPDAASVNVEVKYVPDALEEYLSPAFYLIPAIDNFTENTIYINQGRSMDDIHLFTTLAHEGYPGHLYQTTYYAATDPDPIRTLLNFSGYVEGWATYAEMCSYYISPLEKAYATLLQKNNSFILGLYAAADIGIHYDGWSVEETLSFFSGYGITDEATVQEIYHYILGDPANYITYYVGYLEILELKKDWDGSQKDFHQQVLEIGPAPFEIIEKYMN